MPPPPPSPRESSDAKFTYESYKVYLEGVVEPVHRRRVHGADHLEDAVKVIELLEDLQDLDDARHHGYALLQVLRFHDTPEESTILAVGANDTP